MADDDTRFVISFTVTEGRPPRPREVTLRPIGSRREADGCKRNLENNTAVSGVRVEEIQNDSTRDDGRVASLDLWGFS